MARERERERYWICTRTMRWWVHPPRSLRKLPNLCVRLFHPFDGRRSGSHAGFLWLGGADYGRVTNYFVAFCRESCSKTVHTSILQRSCAVQAARHGLHVCWPNCQHCLMQHISMQLGYIGQRTESILNHKIGLAASEAARSIILNAEWKQVTECIHTECTHTQTCMLALSYYIIFIIINYIRILYCTLYTYFLSPRGWTNLKDS